MSQEPKLVPATITVDRDNAPSTNRRFLPHNMKLHLDIDGTLIVSELGSEFRMEIELEDGLQSVGVDESNVEEIPDDSAAWL